VQHTQRSIAGQEVMTVITNETATELDLDRELPFLARWAKDGSTTPYSSNEMGRSDDTGTWRNDTEEADT